MDIWGRSDVCFHSIDIRKRHRDFAVLHDGKTREHLKMAAKDSTFYILPVVYLLRQNNIEKAVHYVSIFLSALVDDGTVKMLSVSHLLFSELIALCFTHQALQLMREHNLRDKLKPMYYALMYYMQDEYPDEYKKMGGELKQTVEEIVFEINKLKEELKEKKQSN